MRWMAKPPSAKRVFVGAVIAFTCDAMLVGIPFFGCIVMLVSGLARAAECGVSLARRDGPSARRYGLCAGVSLLTVAGIVALFLFNRDMGYRNAREIISAVESYRSDKGEYPERLEDLVPEYLKSVPWSSIRLVSNQYFYFAHEDSHELMWVDVPPFGRPGYVFERRQWWYLD